MDCSVCGTCPASHVSNLLAFRRIRNQGQGQGSPIPSILTVFSPLSSASFRIRLTIRRFPKTTEDRSPADFGVLQA